MIDIGYTECGKCIHWHERKEQRFNLKIGDCDKIAKGTPLTTCKGKYDGYAFEDENYDFDFDCFELKEQKNDTL